MNKKVIIKKKNYFIDKIRQFFKQIFKKTDINNSEKIDTLIENEKNVEYNENNNFQDSIRVEVKNEYLKDLKREAFLEELERKPELLYELPIEKLEKIEKYYDEVIAKYEEKLSKLRKGA